MLRHVTKNSRLKRLAAPAKSGFGRFPRTNGRLVKFREPVFRSFGSSSHLTRSLITTPMGAAALVRLSNSFSL
jgi:hypothetical protein